MLGNLTVLSRLKKEKLTETDLYLFIYLLCKHKEINYSNTA